MLRDKTKVQPPRGTQDLFEGDLKKIEFIISLVSRVARSYGFTKVDTPVLEHVDIFDLTSPINPDKCYIFKDKSGRDLTLRPDLNAPISRAVVNNLLSCPLPIKLFSTAKVFRYRHSAKREFRMWGLECFGAADPKADAEILRIAADVLEEIGLSRVEVEYSSLGVYRKCLNELVPERGHAQLLYDLRFEKAADQYEAMLSYGLPERDAGLLAEMLKQTDQDASFSMLREAASRFKSLKGEIEEIELFRGCLASCGLEESKFNLGNLHGTGFYSGLTYRLKLSGQELADGGRYDHFIEKLSGKRIPATGLGLGIERLIRLAESQGMRLGGTKEESGIYIITDERTSAIIRPVLKKLRSRGCPVETETLKQKRQQAIRYAKFKSYKYAVFITSEGELITLEILHLAENDHSARKEIKGPEKLYDALSNLLL